MGKRFYWLKLFEDFFTSKRIKKLRSIAGGDTYTIIYLKMQLKALKTEGYLYYDGFLGDFAEELAFDLDEEADNVRVTINYLLNVGLLETNDDKAYKLPYLDICTGSETAGAERVRRHRQKVKALQGNTDVTEVKHLGNVEKEIEKEIETDKEKEYIAEQTRHGASGHPEDSLRTKKDNVQQEKKDGLTETSRQIIAHLNEVAGTAYKSNSKATLRHISARLNEGYLLEEFYAVIDKKWREWGGSDMEKYMRPETLFGSKFEGYLNEPETQKKKKGGTKQTSGAVDWDAYV